MNSIVARSLAAAVIAAGLCLSPRIQDSKDSKTEDLAAEVAALKEQAKKTEERLAAAEKKIKASEESIAKAEAWLALVPAACLALDAKVESARANGFEKAGPNPDAKRDVLDGLKGFAKALGAKKAAEDEEEK